MPAATLVQMGLMLAVLAPQARWESSYHTVCVSRLWVWVHFPSLWPCSPASLQSTLVSHMSLCMWRGHGKAEGLHFLALVHSKMGSFWRIFREVYSWYKNKGGFLKWDRSNRQEKAKHWGAIKLRTFVYRKTSWREWKGSLHPGIGVMPTLPAGRLYPVWVLWGLDGGLLWPLWEGTQELPSTRPCLSF